jgi:hypothetical protein
LEDKSGMNNLREKIGGTGTDLVVIDPISMAMSKDINDIAVVSKYQ